MEELDLLGMEELDLLGMEELHLLGVEELDLVGIVERAVNNLLLLFRTHLLNKRCLSNGSTLIALQVCL